MMNSVNGGPVTAERFLSPSIGESPYFGAERVVFHGLHTQPRRSDWHPSADRALYHVFELQSLDHPDRFRTVMMLAGINHERRSAEDALRDAPVAAVGGSGLVQLAWTREDYRRGGLFRALLAYAQAGNHALDSHVPISQEGEAALASIRASQTVGAAPAGIVNLHDAGVNQNVARLFGVIGKPEVHQGALGRLFAILSRPQEAVRRPLRAVAGPGSNPGH